MLPSIRGNKVESRLLDEHSSWLVVQLMFLFLQRALVELQDYTCAHRMQAFVQKTLLLPLLKGQGAK